MHELPEMKQDLHCKQDERTSRETASSTLWHSLENQDLAAVPATALPATPQGLHVPRELAVSCDWVPGSLTTE
jgi:hypothetical protein